MITTVVFAKPPVPGRCKSRLASVIGDEPAAQLARAMLVDVIHMLRAQPDVSVVLSTTDAEADWRWLDVPVRQQPSQPLGARIEEAARWALHEASMVVAVGADAPSIRPAHVQWLREAGRSHGAAILPALDGGFVALALRTCPEGCLDDVRWSTPDACADVISALTPYVGPVAVGDTLHDVDEVADLRWLSEEAAQRSELAACRTWLGAYGAKWS